MKSVPAFPTTCCLATAVIFASMTAHCQEQSQDKKNTPCSTEKVNHDCSLTIDRVNPLQPPTLQMYPRATVTVKIVHALPFEQVSFDWQSSAGALMPDQSSAILNALSANLQKFVAAAALPAPAPPPGAVLPPGVPAPPPDLCSNVLAATAVACAAQIITDARLAVNDIGSLVNDDTLVYNPVTHLPVARSIADYDNARRRILCRTLGGDLPPQTVMSDGVTLIHCESQYHDIVADQQSLANLVSSAVPGSAINTSNIPALVTYTNTLVAPLEGIAQDLLQLNSDQESDGALGTIVDPARSGNPKVPSCNSSLSKAPNSTVYERLLQRQVTCAVNVFNLVANSIASVPATPQKRTILTISVNYADSRIETSAGVMVSALPSRSFAATPVYSGTPPTVSTIVVQETDTRPLIVPYAAVHVRLGSDWLWPDKRRGAVYGTVLVGVNPNTTTADLGAGISLVWRSLVLSPVAHFAHDVRLADGFTNGESLGTSFTGAVPTQQSWTTSFGLGFGIRVPLISGR